MLRVLLWLLAIALGLAAAGLVVVTSARHPSTERDWAPDHARAAWAEIRDSVATLHDMRAFRYAADGGTVAAWTDRTIDLRRLERVWYVLVPLSAAWRGPAHAFVTFGTTDSQFVSISIEARREAGEGYSVWRGVLNDYELVYVVGDELDLIARRLRVDRMPVHLYPVAATPAKVRALFVDLLARATALRAAPEFYHTVTSNCTGNLVAHVNRIAPGTIPGALASLLPGYSDRVARELGLVDSTGSEADARARYRVDPALAEATDPLAFSLAIRRGVAGGM